MILGFTGTRAGLTLEQREGLAAVFAVLPDQLMHGGAVGADTEFDEWYRSVGWGAITKIDIYPATPARSEFWNFRYAGIGFAWLTIHEPMPPLERNEIIARKCDHLLACPAEPVERFRGGTWATVRYARAAGKPITKLLPDGTIERERAR